LPQQTSSPSRRRRASEDITQEFILNSSADSLLKCTAGANYRDASDQFFQTLGQFFPAPIDYTEASMEHDSRQLERKLEAEATERVSEREMSLRREVYLEAASALVHLQTLLGQASNIEYDQRN
jgi:hypothetical protein